MVRLRGGIATVALVLVAATGCELDNAGGSAGPQEVPGGGGAAFAAAEALTVKGRAPKNNYDRGEFGSPWADTDSNSCGTRDDILKRDLVEVKFRADDCTVVSGVLDPDPYTGEDVPYVRGRSKIDVDHIVALSDAWQKGAQQWDDSKRIALANDPLNLLAVDSGTNRGKGDGDTATWLPPNKAYRCTYVAAQVAVKTKYGLWVTSAEQDAMKRVLSTCPEQKLPTGGNPTKAPARFHAD